MASLERARICSISALGIFKYSRKSWWPPGAAGIAVLSGNRGTTFHHVQWLSQASEFGAACAEGGRFVRAGARLRFQRVE